MITLRQDEFATYQRAIERAKDQIAALKRELRSAQERADHAQRVIDAWRAYRAQAHVKGIESFYTLADALDALAQIKPQVAGEEQVS